MGRGSTAHRRGGAKASSKSKSKVKSAPKAKAKARPARRKAVVISPAAGLSIPDVLRAVMTFSREVTAETQERELLELLYRTLRQLLPGRSVAIRIVDPRSLEVTEVLPRAGWSRGRAPCPPMIPRSALDHPNVRGNMPDSLRAQDGSGRTIALVDTPPLLFERAPRRFLRGPGRRAGS